MSCDEEQVCLMIKQVQVKAISDGGYGPFSNIWKGTHVLIKGPTADNAYQIKNQALGSKEQSVELRNRFVSSHTSKEEFRKKIMLHWRVTGAVVA